MAASSVMLTQATFVLHFCVDVFGTIEECFSTSTDVRPVAWLRFTTQFTAMLGLGSVVGSLFSSWLADTAGRRKALIISALIFSVFTAWECITLFHISILTSRFLAGIGAGIMTAVAPTYIMEVAPADLRGQMGGMVPLSLCFGMLTAGMVGEVLAEYPNGWRYTVGLSAVTSLFMLVGMMIFPESPRWLLAVYGEGACANALQILRQSTDVSEELAEMLPTPVPDRSRSESALMWRSVSGPKMWNRLLISCMLQLLQQACGIVLIISYGAVILQMVGMEDTMIFLIFLYIFNAVTTFVAIKKIDTAGRRMLLLRGAVGTSCANLAAAIVLKIGRENRSDDFETDQIIAGLFLLCLALFIFYFSSSFGLVPWVYASEIFPLKTRATAVGLANVAHSIALYAATYFQVLINRTNLAFTYLICAGFCMISTVLIYLFVPETAQKTLEEIDEAFKRHPWDDRTCIGRTLNSFLSWKIWKCFQEKEFTDEEAEDLLKKEIPKESYSKTT